MAGDVADAEEQPVVIDEKGIEQIPGHRGGRFHQTGQLDLRVLAEQSPLGRQHGPLQVAGQVQFLAQMGEFQGLPLGLLGQLVGEPGAVHQGDHHVAGDSRQLHHV